MQIVHRGFRFLVLSHDAALIKARQCVGAFYAGIVAAHTDGTVLKPFLMAFMPPSVTNL
jgi:hypothetical protein